MGQLLRQTGRWLFVIAAFVLTMANAHAQLAQSFYNITNIKTDVLPNAVRLTVETDGNVDMGVNFRDFIDFGTSGNDFSAQPLRKFRLRFVRAKSKIPAFVEIGKYPVDAVNVLLARDKFTDGFFYRTDNYDPNDPTTPAIDLEFRFYVPIKVTYFTFEFGRYFGWNINFPVVLKPLETSIAVSPDRRTVIITVMTDRAESNRRPSEIRRSAPETWHHRLEVTQDTARPVKDTFTLNALHVPLSEILSSVAKTTAFPLQAQTDAAERDVTLYLPNADIPTFLQALRTGYGLSATLRPDSEGGGALIGVGGTPLLSERIPVQYTSPEKLRLLLPDFLLPALRADTENNALIVTGTEAIVAKVKADIARLDVGAATVLVEARAYEIADSDDLNASISALFSQGKSAYDTNAGTVAVNLTPGQSEQYQATLNALAVRGKAKLAARPSVVVQSGNKGTLFFGQTRFIQVLVSNFGEQNAQVIQIPVGTTITVTPTAIADPDADILLELSPRFSTVDATDRSTGLPTLGIREIKSNLRVRPGDTVVVAGLLSESASRVRSGIFGIGAKRHGKSSVALVVFVTAKRVTGS